MDPAPRGHGSSLPPGPRGREASLARGTVLLGRRETAGQRKADQPGALRGAELSGESSTEGPEVSRAER